MGSEQHGGEDDRAEAGAQLAELLLQLHVSGRLKAKEVCCISYWAAKAGAVGPVSDLAHDPKAPSGHFQRRLDRVAGLRGCPEQFFSLRVPVHTKSSAERVVQDIRVLPPHECLHREVIGDPSIVEQFDLDAWPPSFRAHRVVQAAQGATVVPLAFYMDAAQYTKLGAAVVVFVVCNLLSGSRHLVAVLKKKDFCRCGCRGWCTLRPVFAFLDWSFAALASGVFPPTQPDGVPWGDSDPRRLSMVGLPLALRGAVAQVKGDWAEYAHSLGFPTWRHADYPCLWCRCERDSLYAWEDMEPGESPWALTAAGDYDAACARCERHVLIATVQLRDSVAAALFYDKRTNGSRGRALQRDVPELALRAGDRLEPSIGCPDIGAFEDLVPPVTVVFWRSSAETLTKHRNPLFSAVTGITIHTLTVDTLHCLYLGVLQVHCSQVIWGLVAADAWDTRRAGHTTAPARLQESCTRLQAALTTWCRNRRKSHPNEPVTEVQEVTPYILGSSREDQKLGLKGGETKSMFLYLDEVLPSHAAAVANGEHMLAASRALKRHLAVMKDAPRVFSSSQWKEPRTQWVTPTLLNGIRCRTAEATTRSDIDGWRSSVFPFLVSLQPRTSTSRSLWH